jgi:hypothetical protein
VVITDRIGETLGIVATMRRAGVIADQIINRIAMALRRAVGIARIAAAAASPTARSSATHTDLCPHRHSTSVAALRLLKVNASDRFSPQTQWLRRGADVFC